MADPLNNHPHVDPNTNSPVARLHRLLLSMPPGLFPSYPSIDAATDDRASAAASTSASTVSENRTATATAPPRVPNSTPINNNDDDDNDDDRADGGGSEARLRGGGSSSDERDEERRQEEEEEAPGSEERRHHADASSRDEDDVLTTTTTTTPLTPPPPYPDRHDAHHAGVLLPWHAAASMHDTLDYLLFPARHHADVASASLRQRRARASGRQRQRGRRWVRDREEEAVRMPRDVAAWLHGWLGWLMDPARGEGERQRGVVVPWEVAERVWEWLEVLLDAEGEVYEETDGEGGDGLRSHDDDDDDASPVRGRYGRLRGGGGDDGGEEATKRRGGERGRREEVVAAPSPREPDRCPCRWATASGALPPRDANDDDDDDGLLPPWNVGGSLVNLLIALLEPGRAALVERRLSPIFEEREEEHEQRQHRHRHRHRPSPHTPSPKPQPPPTPPPYPPACVKDYEPRIDTIPINSKLRGGFSTRDRPTPALPLPPRPLHAYGEDDDDDDEPRSHERAARASPPPPPLPPTRIRTAHPHHPSPSPSPSPSPPPLPLPSRPRPLPHATATPLRHLPLPLPNALHDSIIVQLPRSFLQRAHREAEARNRGHNDDDDNDGGGSSSDYSSYVYDDGVHRDDGNADTPSTPLWRDCFGAMAPRAVAECGRRFEEAFGAGRYRGPYWNRDAEGRVRAVEGAEVREGLVRRWFGGREEVPESGGDDGHGRPGGAGEGEHRLGSGLRLHWTQKIPVPRDEFDQYKMDDNDDDDDDDDDDDEDADAGGEGALKKRWRRLQRWRRLMQLKAERRRHATVVPVPDLLRRMYEGYPAAKLKPRMDEWCREELGIDNICPRDPLSDAAWPRPWSELFPRHTPQELVALQRPEEEARFGRYDGPYWTCGRDGRVKVVETRAQRDRLMKKWFGETDAERRGRLRGGGGFGGSQDADGEGSSGEGDGWVLLGEDGESVRSTQPSSGIDAGEKSSTGLFQQSGRPCAYPTLREQGSGSDADVEEELGGLFDSGEETCSEEAPNFTSSRDKLLRDLNQLSIELAILRSLEDCRRHEQLPTLSDFLHEFLSWPEAQLPDGTFNTELWEDLASELQWTQRRLRRLVGARVAYGRLRGGGQAGSSTNNGSGGAERQTPRGAENSDAPSGGSGPRRQMREMQSLYDRSMLSRESLDRNGNTVSMPWGVILGALEERMIGEETRRLNNSDKSANNIPETKMTEEEERHHSDGSSGSDWEEYWGNLGPKRIPARATDSDGHTRTRDLGRALRHGKRHDRAEAGQESGDDVVQGGDVRGRLRGGSRPDHADSRYTDTKSDSQDARAARTGTVPSSGPGLSKADQEMLEDLDFWLFWFVFGDSR